VLVYREDRAQLVADMKSLRAAHDKALLEARTKYVTTNADKQQEMDRLTAEEIDRQTTAEAGDWVEVEKRVSSGGAVDIAAVSVTEVELKRRVDKLSSMITEVCSALLCGSELRACLSNKRECKIDYELMGLVTRQSLRLHSLGGSTALSCLK